ncbi:MAG: NAD(P)/FAD-dependent oxidoreductase [Actinomycetota bacterium]|nr:NAD(P)/FAD-dependent oxidoreductase [Actinomycetota bacterium]
MNMEHVDAIVLGLGPGGEEVAGRLAEAGLHVVGIDHALVGGECPYWGCVPSKMMIRAANLLAEARRIPGMAGSAEVQPDWAPVAARIRAEATDNWDDTVAVERFEGKGGRFVRGHGRLTGRDTVTVGDRTFRASRALVVATGGQPSIPPIAGLAETPYWTNHQAIEAEQLPRSMIVLGGGAIGAEVAQVFARFGVDITIVEAAPLLLPLEEPEVGPVLAEVLSREGLTVITGVGAERVQHDEGRFAVHLADGRLLEAERLLVATGRRVDLAAIGAAALGVVPSAKALPVDEHLRVTDGVWAVGDVTGKGAFTHVAMYQAGIAVADILGTPHSPAAYDALPRVTFTDPEVASVGLSTQAAVDAGIAVATGRVETSSTARGWIHKAGNEGFIHLVADRRRGVLVGATVIGPNAGEVLGLLTLAIHAAVPISALRTMVYAYPTFHRGVEDALRDLP